MTVVGSMAGAAYVVADTNPENNMNFRRLSAAPALEPCDLPALAPKVLASNPRRARWSMLGSACLLAALSGCGGSPGGSPGASTDATTTAPSSGTSDSTTAAYGVLGTPTARIAFVPAPGGVTPFVLESTDGKAVTWGGTTVLSNLPPTVPLTFTASACTVDSDNLRTVCIGYGSSEIAVLDLSKFVGSLQISDIRLTEFDSGAGSVPNVYSGASCILCGVAADIGKKRFIVGGAGGFRVFDYGSTSAAAVYDIPVGENFAFLPQAGGASVIVAPEYAPNGGQRKLRVVDLDAGKVYVWDKNTDSAADLGTGGSVFQTSEVDAASIDASTRTIVLSSEDSATFLLVDFGQAVFDPAALTFSAPLAFALPDPATPVPRLSDLAISTSGSILLSHEEAGSNVGVTQLPTVWGSTAPGALGVLDLNDTALDHSPCGASFVFAGKGDPHGLSLYAGLSGGQRGLVIDAGNSCAAVLDLVGLRDAPHSATDPNRIDTAAPGVSAMVRFVKLR
ncbi:MAG: hypothetical protein ABT20_05905 [Rubrivivax sp. SCN 70-15]|nr:MAG: hypothetical protein ABT20_05905 [Rubrivivax sp. SCN 70-15]